MDFTKFVDILNSESLFFTRADRFEDSFEGAITKQNAKRRELVYAQNEKALSPEFWQKHYEEMRSKMAINCWHMNDYESAAMWVLYLKSNEGIAIQSTYERFVNCFNSNPIDIFIGAVNYVDYENDSINIHNVFSRYLSKRKSFEHEKELRAVIWESGTKVPIEIGAVGCKIKVQLKDLMENIYVSPQSPTWLTDLVKDTCKRFGFDFNVINSRLNDSPIF